MDEYAAAYAAENPSQVCSCGHHLVEHDTVAVGADNVEFFCVVGGCGCNTYFQEGDG